MKKNLLTKLILVASVFGLTITTAGANIDDLKFYAGAGVDYTKYGIDKTTFKKAKVQTTGLGLLAPILGVKVCDNVGLEAGYSFNKSIKVSDKRKQRTFKVNNVYLDLMGFIPIIEQADAILGIGISKLMVKKGKNISSEMEIKNKLNWRAKLGAQYNITGNFAVRALLSYQNVGNKLKVADQERKFIKNMKSLGLSAIWTF
jgi:opacity protein-like surface antigen